jgi:RHS repeat-associated protein
MGRRVQKTVSSYDGATWTETENKLFVYDGWNLIEELDGTGTTQKSYVWGLDLSQSLQGAGGVGGLLASVDSSANTYYYCYDGNGNVGQMIDASDGSIAAHYEYDPFGNTVHSTGTLASDNPFRFSTKYIDDESELYYYGYRYYSPELGRWNRRDPLGEKVGINLYLFINNEALNKYDLLGLTDPRAIIMKALLGCAKELGKYWGLEEINKRMSKKMICNEIASKIKSQIGEPNPKNKMECDKRYTFSSKHQEKDIGTSLKQAIAKCMTERTPDPMSDGILKKLIEKLLGKTAKEAFKDEIITGNFEITADCISEDSAAYTLSLVTTIKYNNETKQQRQKIAEGSCSDNPGPDFIFNDIQPIKSICECCDYE